MKRVLIALVASIGLMSAAHANGGHHHGSNTGAIVLGSIVGGYVLGQVINQNRPVIVQQPQVIYAPQPQVIYVPQRAPVQQCEVKILADQFGQMREFTSCYYR